MEISAQIVIWYEAACAGFSNSGKLPTSVRAGPGVVAGDPAGADLPEERRGLQDVVDLVRRRRGAEGPGESTLSNVG